MANPPTDAIAGAITHDNQTEGYYIVSGGGMAFIDGHVVNGRHSKANPTADRTVRAAAAWRLAHAKSS
jgi:hypothetical protein